MKESGRAHLANIDDALDNRLDGFLLAQGAAVRVYSPTVDDPDFAAKLNGVAALLVNDVIGAAEPDDRAVQLDLAPAQGEAAELTLTPKEPLAPGSYVVMWRILSADTHVLQAFMTFTVTP